VTHPRHQGPLQPYGLKKSSPSLTKADETDRKRSAVGACCSAVVIGGSLAGLSTAAALADRVDQVTLVERDRFPTGLRTASASRSHGTFMG
jgi:heterodisulfide reductase subunit A-like polyferredoxin